MSQPYPPSGQPPRSTPIPGAPPPLAPGSFGGPTPGGSFGGPVPGGSFGQPPTGGPTAPPSPPGGLGFDPDNPPRRPRSGRRVVALLALVVILGIAASLAAVLFAIGKSNDAIERVSDQVGDALSDAGSTGDPSPSGDTGTSTAAPIEVTVLWTPESALRLAEQFDGAIPGEPTRFTEILIYPDYAFATAQDPARPDRLDRYEWRNGRVGNQDPQPDDADLAGRTFTIDEVPWDRLAQLLVAAERELGVEQPASRYFIIDRDGSTADVSIRVYVSGARGGGYVLADATATIVTVYR